jgi:GAF domain-containing protein/DNA-binding response OmpR family regulator
MENTITLFIADDDLQIRESSEMLLGIKGVKAHTFESGSALLAALNVAEPEHLPTAALIDFVMEGGGEELVEQLHEKFPDLPVIVYTGKDTPGSMRAFNLGAYAIMEKPLDYNELHDILKELNEREKLFTQLAKDAMSITGFETTIVWLFDKSKKHYKIVGWAGELDIDFVQQFTLTSTEYPRVNVLKKGNILTLEDIQASEVYRDKEEAKKRMWESVVSIPLIRHQRLIGFIDCYKLRQKYDKTADQNWEIKSQFLKIFASQSTESFHSAILTQQLRVLHETSQSLSGTMDYKLIYDTILSKAKSVTGADCGWIYEYDNGEKILKMGHSFGLENALTDSVRPLDGSGITSYVAREGISFYVPDVQQKSENFTPEMFIPVAELPIRCVLSIPLRRSNRTLGVITLKSTEIDFFSQEDSQLMTSLAAVAALSMERSKLTYHLSEIGKLSQDSTEFTVLSQYVVDAVRDLTDTDVNLWMASTKEDEGDDWMRIVCSSKSKKTPEYANYIETAKVPIQPKKSLIAVALQERRHVIVEDLHTYDHVNNPPFHNITRIKEFGWHSFMTIPLIGKKEEYLGAISLFSEKINRFSDDDGRLIQHFANQAALVLQKQRYIAILQELTSVGQNLNMGMPGAIHLSRRVTTMAKEIAEADFTVLYPFDPEKENHYDKGLYAYSGILHSDAKGFTDRPRENGMSAYIRQKGMIIVENIIEDKIILKIGKSHEVVSPKSEDYQNVFKFIKGSDLIQRENVRAFVGIALSALEHGTQTHPQKNDVAVLYINYRAPHHFTDEDLQVLDIFCSQVANIIHRNRLYDSVLQQRKVLESLSNSALHIMATSNEKERLASIVEESVKLLNAKGGKVYLVINGSRKDLELVASIGLPAELTQSKSVITKSEGMAGRVLSTGEPEITADYANYPYRIPAFSHFFSAVLEVPLRIGKEVIGVLSVFDDKASRIFTQSDLSILQRLADQAALSIFNSRLTDELDALHQTTKQIVAQADLKDMADKILKELRRIIQYDRASFQVFKNEHEPRQILAMQPDNQPSNSQLERPIDEDNLIKAIVASQKIKLISDTNKEPLWGKDIKETKQVRSWICIPLVYEGKVLGLLMLDHFIKGYYQLSDLAKLQRFADLAAIALYNTQIDQRHLFELQKFASRVAQIGPEDKVEQIFIESVGIMEEMFKPERYLFHYQDHEYFRKRKPILDTLRPHFKTTPLRTGEGLAGWVAQEGDAKLYPDDFDTKLYPNIQLEQGQSLIFAPIWYNSKVVGVLELEAVSTEYDHNRKSFLSILILQGSLAIQHIEQRERRSSALQKRFNPYILGTPVRNPEHFFGRTEVLESILAGLYNNNYAVVDKRRLGKTSLLFRLEYELKYELSNVKQEILPVYFSLEGVEYTAFYPLLINKIRQAFDLNNIEIPQYKDYDYHNFKDDLYELKKIIKAEFPLRNAIVVLLIDEIDALSLYPEIIQQQLRSILVEERLLRVVMAGYKINFKENSLTSPWYNFLKILKIGHFTDPEARDLITKPVAGYYIYQNEAIDLIVKKGNFKPRNIQYYCSEALSNMFQRLGKVVSDILPVILLEDVESVKPEENTTEYNI